MKVRATLRVVRRGDDLNELQLVTTDNRVIILLGYGLTSDEAVRTANEALQLLSEAFARQSGARGA